MNKILLIPGSFNPITNAHVDMALAAKKVVNADTIYFIPAHDTYVAKKKTLIPGYCRVSLINSMPNCKQNNMWALDIETTSFFPQRTYNTITQIRDEANFGFTYDMLDEYIRTGMIDNEVIKNKIDIMHAKNLFKLQLMPSFKPELSDLISSEF